MDFKQMKEQIGEEVYVSDWLQVTQEMISAFADVTMDHQWIHVDAERANASPFGTTIAHGYFILSLIPKLNEGFALAEGFAMGINYGLDKVRFTNPVASGSYIRSRLLLVEVQEIANGVKLKHQVKIEIKGMDKPACIAETWVLLLRES